MSRARTRPRTKNWSSVRRAATALAAICRVAGIAARTGDAVLRARVVAPRHCRFREGLTRYTLPTGGAGEPTAPGRRSGGAVSRKRLRWCALSQSASAERYQISPRTTPSLKRQCASKGPPRRGARATPRPVIVGDERDEAAPGDPVEEALVAPVERGAGVVQQGERRCWILSRTCAIPAPAATPSLCGAHWMEEAGNLRAQRLGEIGKPAGSGAHLVGREPGGDRGVAHRLRGARGRGRARRGLVDVAGDLARRMALLLHGRGDGGRDLADLADGAADALNGLDRFACRRLDPRDLCADVVGRLGRLAGEGLDLGRDHGKALAGVAGAGRLDRRVEREQIGLAGDVGDELHH